MILITPCMLLGQWSVQTSGTSISLTDVAFSNLNTGIAVSESGIMLKTTNKGVTWVHLPSLTSAYLSTIYFADANTGWIGGENGIIFKTTNRGESWISQTFQEPYTISDIFFLNANTGVAVGELGFIITTSNGGTNWTQQNREIGQHANGVFFVDENTGWIAGGNGQNVGTILKSTDGGQNWFNQTSGTSEALYKVHFTDVNTGTMVGSGGVILRTTNGGDIWTHQTSGTSTFLMNLFFANNDNGIIVGLNGIILRTTNGGSNWVQQSSGTSRLLMGVSFPDNNLNLGWAVGENGIILRYTGTVPTAPDNLSVVSIGIGEARLSWKDNSNNEDGFILQRRDEVNTHWIVVDSIPSNTLHYVDSGLALNREYSWRMYSYNVVGRSAYTDTVFLVPTNVEINPIIIPEKFALYQNYPNPFNPETKINFDIPRADNVKLVVYDVLGKEIAHLVNGMLQAGHYEVSWNANALSGGVYFYKLQAGSFTLIKKLVLSK